MTLTWDAYPGNRRPLFDWRAVPPSRGHCQQCKALKTRPAPAPASLPRALEWLQQGGSNHGCVRAGMRDGMAARRRCAGHSPASVVSQQWTASGTMQGPGRRPWAGRTMLRPGSPWQRPAGLDAAGCCRNTARRTSGGAGGAQAGGCRHRLPPRRHVPTPPSCAVLLNPLSCAGRVRTKTVKKASRVIIEKYYQRLTLDFDTNKRICEEVAIIQSKRLRNKIAGFTTVSCAWV